MINSHLSALKCQLFDWFPTFHSKYNILNDLVVSTQISTFWLIPNFVLNFNILINSLFCNQIPTQHFDQFTLQLKNISIWSISPFLLKFQHFDWSRCVELKFQYFDQFSPYCTETSTFWLFFNFSLKYQHFDRFWRLALKFQYFDRFPFCPQISIFWSIP